MAQVNSTPGVPPTLPTVPSNMNEVGTDAPKAFAKATVVPAAESHTGSKLHI